MLWISGSQAEQTNGQNDGRKQEEIQQEIQHILASQQCTWLIISKANKPPTPVSGTKQTVSRAVQTTDEMPALRKLPQECSGFSTTTCPTVLCTHRSWWEHLRAAPPRGGSCQPGREMGTYPRGHTGTVAPSPLKVCLPTAQIPHYYLQKKWNKPSFQSWLLYIVSNNLVFLWACIVMV